MLAFKKEIEDQIEAQAAAARSPKSASAPTLA